MEAQLTELLTRPVMKSEPSSQTRYPDKNTPMVRMAAAF